mmetsp:Transcript_37681/g.99580  ORF Transcript_37681/g.99580 Transcript_37681/m.99580 type:complete len:110 (+) Transcript_37681:83-412(+)
MKKTRVLCCQRATCARLQPHAVCLLTICQLDIAAKGNTMTVARYCFTLIAPFTFYMASAHIIHPKLPRSLMAKFVISLSLATTPRAECAMEMGARLLKGSITQQPSHVH